MNTGLKKIAVGSLLTGTLIAGGTHRSTPAAYKQAEKALVELTAQFKKDSTAFTNKAVKTAQDTIDFKDAYYKYAEGSTWHNQVKSANPKSNTAFETIGEAAESFGDFLKECAQGIKNSREKITQQSY